MIAVGALNVGIRFLPLLGYGALLFLNRPRAAGRAFPFILALGLTLLGAWQLLFARAERLTCEDGTCGRPAWREEPHAWQHMAQYHVAAIGFLAILCALVFIILEKRRAAFFSTVVATVAWAVWYGIWSQG